MDEKELNMLLSKNYSFVYSFIQRIFMKHLSNSSYTLSIVLFGISLYFMETKYLESIL